MPAKQVLLICGYINSGKTTAANHITTVRKSQVTAFAEPLKNISLDALRFFGYNVTSLDEMEIMKRDKVILVRPSDVLCAILVMIAAMSCYNWTMWTAAISAIFCAMIYKSYRKKTVRDVLITIGAILREHIDKDIFVQAAYNKIQRADNDTTVIIQDCRFVNELEFIHKKCLENGIPMRLLYVERCINGEMVKPEFVGPTEMPELLIEYAKNNGCDWRTLYNYGELRLFHENIIANID